MRLQPRAKRKHEIGRYSRSGRRTATNRKKTSFFVLGDNSPQSQDGRFWCTDPNWRGSSDREYWVDRELFIGKALFIYWPHGWPVRIGKVPLVPFINPIPNFGRMHFVR